MNALIMLKSASCPASLRLRERLTRDSSTAQPEPVGAQAGVELAGAVRTLRTKNRAGYEEQISGEHQGAAAE